MKAWLDGRLVEAGAPALRLDDRGFTLGDGLFETFRVVEGEPQHLARHLERLAAGAVLLQIPPPPAVRLEQALAETLAANGPEVAVLRLTLTRGPGRRGLAVEPDASPTLAVTAAAAAPPHQPLRLAVVERYRRDAASPLSRVKAIPYLANVLARLEAQRAGAEEALLLNHAGRPVSATAANLFALIDGRVVTPPLDEGPLPGIVRALVLEMGLAEEQPITREALARAEALVLTNSLGIRVVSALEGHVLPLASGEALARRLAVAAALD